MAGNMSVFINKDIVPADLLINETIARHQIEEQCGLKISAIELLGEGFDNAVYLVNHHLVFRFPRRTRAISLLEREITLLPYLNTKLMLKIPNPIYFGNPSCAYKSPFFGHELIKGHSGCRVQLTLKEYRRAASTLGQFLKTLHHTDIAQYFPLTPAFDRADYPKLLELFNIRWPLMKKQFDLGYLSSKVCQISENASHNTPKLPGTTLVHGDLYHRHLLFDDHQDLCGVIDWGEACQSDSAVDLGVLYQYFPLEVHEDFLSAYGEVEPETLVYARFVGLYYAVTFLWFGHGRNDKNLIKSSLKSLREI